MSWRPKVEEERGDALRDRGIKVQPASRWRRHGVVLSVVFFILTAFGIAAFFFLCEVLHFPKGLVTAILCIGAAEWLIHGKRFFGTGIESALWLGGLLAIIFDLPSSGKPEALLVFAAAFAIAGFRVRSALFGAGAAVFVLAYIRTKTGDPSMSVMFGAVVTLIAAAARQRMWRRPSTDQLFAALTIVMPVAAAVSGERIVAFAILAVLLLALGIACRDRIVLIAAGESIAIAAYHARDLFPYPLEAKLIVAGALVAAIAMIVSRALAGRTRGFTVAPEEVTGYDEAMQIAGAISLAQPATPAPTAQPVEGGGGFGGAGAGGEY